jgi:hypothetical protein
MTPHAAVCCVGAMGVTALACAWVDAHALAQSRNAETPALSMRGIAASVIGDHLLAQMTPSTSTTNTTPVTVA